LPVSFHQKQFVSLQRRENGKMLLELVDGIRLLATVNQF
jgi:hypothetical protein